MNPPAASKVLQNFECATLGVNDQQLAVGFYPNPTKNIVNLEISEDFHYHLISPFGQRLLEGYLTSDNKQIDLSPFPTGMYFLHIEGRQIIKLIKYN